MINKPHQDDVSCLSPLGLSNTEKQDEAVESSSLEGKSIR